MDELVERIRQAAEDDIACLETCFRMADECFEREDEADGTYTTVSEAGVVVHLAPLPGRHACAWAEVGPAISDICVPGVMGLGQYYAVGSGVPGAWFVLDERGCPCIGFEIALPDDLSEWNQVDFDAAVIGDYPFEGFESKAIDCHRQARGVLAALVETAAILCMRANPVIGPLSVGERGERGTLYNARSRLVKEAIDGEPDFKKLLDSKFLFGAYESIDGWDGDDYGKCDEVRLVKRALKPRAGTTFVKGRMCKVSLDPCIGGGIAASMTVPGSKRRNQREAEVLHRLKVLGAHLLEEPESVWRNVYVRLDDGEVIFKRDYVFDYPSADEVDDFMRDATGFIADYRDELLEEGSIGSLMEMVEESQHVCDLVEKAKWERLENKSERLARKYGCAYRPGFASFYDDEPYEEEGQEDE